MSDEEIVLSNGEKVLKFLFAVVMCGFFVTVFYAVAPGFMIGQEQVDVQMTVLSKDIMTSDCGIPTYSVTFDSPDGAFVYWGNYNNIDVYNSVSVGENCTCTYYRYWQNDMGIKHSLIVKINGVSVE